MPVTFTFQSPLVIVLCTQDLYLHQVREIAGVCLLHLCWKQNRGIFRSEFIPSLHLGFDLSTSEALEISFALFQLPVFESMADLRCLALQSSSQHFESLGRDLCLLVLLLAFPRLPCYPLLFFRALSLRGLLLCIQRGFGVPLCILVLLLLVTVRKPCAYPPECNSSPQLSVVLLQQLTVPVQSLLTAKTVSRAFCAVPLSLVFPAAHIIQGSSLSTLCI